VTTVYKEIGGGSYPYHSGGPIKAHGGLMLGSYGGKKEIPFVGLEDEFVLRSKVGERFGMAALEAFNNTLNPDVLGGNAGGKNITIEVNPRIVINEALPETWVRVVDKRIHPRLKYKERFMEVQEGVF